METFGPYQLIERLEVGASTETFFAVGPGLVSEQDPVRLTRMASYATANGALGSDWVARHQEALALRAPFERTFFLGELNGRRVQVREPGFGVGLRELARAASGVPAGVATRTAIELCEAIAQWDAPSAIRGIDDRALRIGWDGALRIHAIDLQSVDRRLWLQSPEEARGELPGPQSAVFRICAVLAVLLSGRAPPQPTPEFPAGLRQLVTRNLGSSAAERVQGLAALKGELAPFAAAADEAQALRAELACARFAQRHACDLSRLASVGLGGLEEGFAAPADAPGWLVLSDQLQSRGDPRGELIAIHAQRDLAADANERERLDDEAQRLINRHGTLVPPIYARAAKFEWRFGYVRSAELVRTGSRYVLPMLLSHPSLRFLEELTLTTGGTGDAEQRVHDLCERKPPRLKVLKMPALTAEHRAKLAHAMPWLERIEVASSAEPPGFFRRLLRRLR